MNEYKLFVRRIGLVGITNILVALSSLILIPIMTKNFSIEDYGIWVQINTTLTLLPNFALLGLHNTMLRFLSAEKDKKVIQETFYSIVSLILVSSFIISALLFIFSKNVAITLFNGDINLVKLLSIIVFLSCLNALLITFFRTFQQMNRFSILLIMQTYLGLFTVSYFTINGFGIFITTLGLLFANLITFLIMVPFIISNIGFKIPKFKNFRRDLSFGLPTIPSYLSYWIVDSSDRYLIGIILGSAFVGYYSPGYMLGNIITLILAPFSLLLPSVLPKYFDDNNMEDVRKFLKYSLKLFLLIGIPSAFGLSLLSKPILMIISTTEIALNGYLITPFTALSALLFGIYGIISNIIILKKKTKIIGIIWIITAILNLGLNILIIPYLGILGAAAATLIAYTATFSLTLHYSLRFFTFEFDMHFISKSILSSILFSFIILLIGPNGTFSILITIIICSMVYFVSLFLIGGIKKEEFTIFKKIITK